MEHPLLQVQGGRGERRCLNPHMKMLGMFGKSSTNTASMIGWKKNIGIVPEARMTEPLRKSKKMSIGQMFSEMN